MLDASTLYELDVDFPESELSLHELANGITMLEYALESVTACES